MVRGWFNAAKRAYSACAALCFSTRETPQCGTAGAVVRSGFAGSHLKRRFTPSTSRELINRIGRAAVFRPAQLSGSHTRPHGPLQPLQCAGWPKVSASCHSCASLLH